jgi:5-methylcytosine-specific restriction enzyme subunit McrC
MKKEVIQFFEYDKVKFNKPYPLVDCDKPLDFGPYIIALRDFHTKSDGYYYDLIDNGIRFKEQVGVIQLGNLTIEVLPKIDRDETDSAKWHDILLDMLKECRFIDPHSTGYAHLKLKPNSILELYIEKYISELESLLHRGLIKKYTTEEGNQSALKGSLMFAKHLQHNLTHAERFFVNYTVYNPNHTLHQILFQALEVINKVSANTTLTDRIKTLLVQWPQSKPINVTSKTFDTIQYSRKTQPYKEALLIARMILLNYHPDLRGGRQSVLALMFNMNKLWEEFIFRRLKLMEKSLNWKVSSQKGFKYWTGDSGSKKLIPDVVIHQLDNGENIVIDTKWKRPSKNKPDDNDLRQLLSYKLYYEGYKAYLLYPCSTVKSNTVEGKYTNNVFKQSSTVFKEGFGLHGGLLFINILNGKKLIDKNSAIYNWSNLTPSE